jgi:hypothetical protein
MIKKKISNFRIKFLIIIKFISYTGLISALCLFGKKPKQDLDPHLAGIAEQDAALSNKPLRHVDMLATRIGDRNYVFITRSIME